MNRRKIKEELDSLESVESSEGKLYKVYFSNLVALYKKKYNLKEVFGNEATEAKLNSENLEDWNFYAEDYMIVKEENTKEKEIFIFNKIYKVLKWIGQQIKNGGTKWISNGNKSSGFII